MSNIVMRHKIHTSCKTNYIIHCDTIRFVTQYYLTEANDFI